MSNSDSDDFPESDTSDLFYDHSSGEYVDDLKVIAEELLSHDEIVAKTAFQKLLTVITEDLFYHECWPQLKDGLRQALLVSDAVFAHSVFDYHTRLFLVALPHQTGEIYENLLMALLACPQLLRSYAEWDTAAAWLRALLASIVSQQRVIELCTTSNLIGSILDSFHSHAGDDSYRSFLLRFLGVFLLSPDLHVLFGRSLSSVVELYATVYADPACLQSESYGVVISASGATLKQLVISGLLVLRSAVLSENVIRLLTSALVVDFTSSNVRGFVIREVCDVLQTFVSTGQRELLLGPGCVFESLSSTTFEPVFALADALLSGSQLLDSVTECSVLSTAGMLSQLTQCHNLLTRTVHLLDQSLQMQSVQSGSLKAFVLHCCDSHLGVDVLVRADAALVAAQFLAEELIAFESLTDSLAVNECRRNELHAFRRQLITTGLRIQTLAYGGFLRSRALQYHLSELSARVVRLLPQLVAPYERADLRHAAMILRVLSETLNCDEPAGLADTPLISVTAELDDLSNDSLLSILQSLSQHIPLTDPASPLGPVIDADPEEYRILTDYLSELPQAVLGSHAMSDLVAAASRLALTQPTAPLRLCVLCLITALQLPKHTLSEYEVLANSFLGKLSCFSAQSFARLSVTIEMQMIRNCPELVRAFHGVGLTIGFVISQWRAAIFAKSCSWSNLCGFVRLVMSEGSSCIVSQCVISLRRQSHAILAAVSDVI